MKQIGMLIAVAVLTLSGCGSEGPTPAEKAAASKSAAAEQAAKDRAEAAAKKKAKQTAVFKECSEVTRGLDDKLSELNSRLSVGMQFDDYTRRVGAVQVAYDKLIKEAKARGGLSDQCVDKVALPLQTALNAYNTAYNVWNDCNSDYNCSINEGDAKRKIQGAWAKASAKIEKSETALAALQPAA